ncbi:unnamed protein product [Dicrocoelium dendriticum]|nr:unnamed protein product [Dicrocoelium dendriticum]
MWYVLELSLLLICIQGALSLYERYKLMRLQPENESATHEIFDLVRRNGGLYEIWRAQRKEPAHIYLSVAPDGMQRLQKILQKYNVPSEVQIADINEFIAATEQQHTRKRIPRSPRIMWRKEHDNYRTVREIEATLEELTSKYPFVQLETIGQTFENRSIKALKISTDHSKPIIWIDAGMHAREWIAPAAAMYFVDKLLTPGGQSLLNDYQFIVVPLVNPDGYAYTHTTDRLWRKNRSRRHGESCVGVDLNRNFPLNWGVGDGSSIWACDSTYMGKEPASELESKAVIKHLTERKDQLVLYLNLHSYGQYILTPFGYSRFRYPSNYENMLALGRMVQEEIRKRHNYHYRVGSAADLLYEASGGIDDYVAGVLGVPYTYTMELSDEGRYGFLLPPSYIRTVGKQLWTAVKVFAQHM